MRKGQARRWVGFVVWTLVAIRTASALPCAPYDPLEKTNRHLTLGASDPSALADWVTRTISIAKPGETPDLFWDSEFEVVKDAGGERIAERVRDKCAFARVVSGRRMMEKLRDLSQGREFSVVLWPGMGPPGVYYDKEELGLTIRPPTHYKPAYLIVFSLSGSGKIGFHFPVREWGDGDGLVQGRDAINPFGYGRHAAKVEQPFGVEAIIAIASERRQQKLVDALSTLSPMLAKKLDDPSQRIDPDLCDGECRLSDYEEMVRPVFERLIQVVTAPGSALTVREFYSNPKVGRPRAELPLSGGPRVALVIGNQAYKWANSLRTPVNDANAVGKVLQRQGFALVGGKVWTDVSLADLNDARAQLFDLTKAKKPEAVVVYYAGHGIGTSGANYLVPVDAKLTRFEDLEHEAMSAKWLMAAATAFAAHGILILDACRRNTFPADKQSSAPGARQGSGLRENELRHTVQFYSTRTGQIADDGEAGAKHSPFASVLLKHLPEKAVFQQIFARVTVEIRKYDPRRLRTSDAGQEPQLDLDGLSDWEFQFEPQ